MRMRNISRRASFRFAAGGLVAPAICGHARAADVIWRLGHAAPLDTPLHRRLLEAADAIEKRSDGQMRLTVVGEGRAGIQSGLLAQVRDGGIEMAVASCGSLGSILPVCSVPSIGFLFSDYKAVWSAMDGELGQLIRAQIPTRFGMMVLDRIWDFGFRHVTTSTRPIQTAADIAGLKIRTQIDSEEMDMFRALSVTPVVITLPYLRMALEHRQVDGQEGMLAVVRYARLNEVQGYCALTRHIWDGLWLCVNPAAWRNLPDRLQHVVANTLNGAARRQREDSAAMEDSLKATLARGGMKFVAVNSDSFREVLREKGYYALLKTRLGEQTWNVIQKATAIPA